MTDSQIYYIFYFALLVCLVLIDLIRKYIFKKQVREKGLFFIVLFPLLHFFFSMDASYSVDDAEWKRMEYGIPPLSPEMELEKRSRFTEVWVNKANTSPIKHAVKEITLGDGIEKEQDYFTNNRASTVIQLEHVISIYSSEGVRKRFYLFNGALSPTDILGMNPKWTEIAESQKDSVFESWSFAPEVQGWPYGSE